MRSALLPLIAVRWFAAAPRRAQRVVQPAARLCAAALNSAAR
jgi:hypothetical protein